MIFKSVFPKFVMSLSILGVSVVAGAQAKKPEGATLPPRGSDKYWLVVDEFADHAVHFAYAKRFVQLHERSLTDRQCRQYSRIAAGYATQLAEVNQAGMRAESGFWKDMHEYSIGMIGPPGVPIPVHRNSNYWVTTGSEAEDRELRRIVSLEIDEASTGEYSPLALNPQCRTAGQEPTAKAQP